MRKKDLDVYNILKKTKNYVIKKRESFDGNLLDTDFDKYMIESKKCIDIVSEIEKVCLSMVKEEIFDLNKKVKLIIDNVKKL